LDRIPTLSLTRIRGGVVSRKDYEPAKTSDRIPLASQLHTRKYELRTDNGRDWAATGLLGTDNWLQSQVHPLPGERD
jgi:hypothetical protein